MEDPAIGFVICEMSSRMNVPVTMTMSDNDNVNVIVIVIAIRRQSAACELAAQQRRSSGDVKHAYRTSD